MRSEPHADPARHGSRTERIARALHEAGTSGATSAEIAVTAGVPRYLVDRFVRSAAGRRRVVSLAARRDSRGHLVDVWGCRCPVMHATPPKHFWGDAETRRVARIGIDRAREALALRKTA